MLQTDESRLVQQSLTNYVHRDDRKLFAEMLETLFLNGKAQSLQLRLKQSKATYFWARIEAALAFDLVESTVARIVVIDITERKQAEEKQQRNTAVQTALREWTHSNESMMLLGIQWVTRCWQRSRRFVLQHCVAPICLVGSAERSLPRS